MPFYTLGAIAQLVDHLHGMQVVSGSSPLGSINLFINDTGFITIVSKRLNLLHTYKL